jgi:hypothetical protein
MHTQRLRAGLTSWASGAGRHDENGIGPRQRKNLTPGGVSHRNTEISANSTYAS